MISISDYPVIIKIEVDFKVLKINAVNALTKKRIFVDNSELISKRTFSNDFILSIPHGGCVILEDIEKKYNTGKSMFIGTDMFTHELFNINNGVVISTLLNNYMVNMNRFEGTHNIPSLPEHLKRDPFSGMSLTDEEIILEDLNDEEKENLMNKYVEYHQLIQETIKVQKQKKGFALLFDCHSMNSVDLKSPSGNKEKRPDFCIGTVDGTSADKRIIDALVGALRENVKGLGYTVEVDNPFKGGAITRLYGRPEQKSHAIQIEVKKSLYMNEILDKNSKEEFKYDRQKLTKINDILKKSIMSASNTAKEVLK